MKVQMVSEDGSFVHETDYRPWPATPFKPEVGDRVSVEGTEYLIAAVKHVYPSDADDPSCELCLRQLPSRHDSHL